MKTIRIFYLNFFFFLVVKFSIYLNRNVSNDYSDTDRYGQASTISSLFFSFFFLFKENHTPCKVYRTFIYDHINSINSRLLLKFTLTG